MEAVSLEYFSRVLKRADSRIKLQRMDRHRPLWRASSPAHLHGTGSHSMYASCTAALEILQLKNYDSSVMQQLINSERRQTSGKQPVEKQASKHNSISLEDLQ